MRILIHAANLTSGGGLAIGMEIIRAWLARDVPLFVLASPPIAAFLEQEGFPGKNWICIPHSPGSSLRAGADFRKIARRAEAFFRPDRVFTIFGPPLWRPRALHVCGFANGLYFPTKPVLAYGEAPDFRKTLLHRIRRWLVFRSMKKDTDLIWVETEAARGKLSGLIRDKAIQVVSNELSAAFKGRYFPEKAVSERPCRVLMVAADYPHKNFSLLRALLRLPDISGNFIFQTTLPGDSFNQYFPETASVQNLGSLSSQALAAAYADADIIFCPSRAEIFSATWIEAMAARRPLLCADIAAARALCGNAALYFEDNQPAAAAQALQKLAESRALQNTLIQNGLRRLTEIRPTTSRTDRLYELLTQMAAEKPTSL